MQQDSQQKFGDYLREKRLQLGITQAALANMAGCAEITVRKIERNKLRPSVQLAKLLVKSVDTPPREMTQLIHLARQDVLTRPRPSHTDLNKLKNPFVGLEPFSEETAINFFGREPFVDRILATLSDGTDLSNFLAVVGPSGSGKSSLVRAGLVPAVRKGRLHGAQPWRIETFTPGTQPLERLARLLNDAGFPIPTDLYDDEVQSDHLTHQAAERSPILLVIDQFEEIFTLVDNETTRLAFLDALVTLALSQENNIWIVITMRADFMDKPLLYVDFGELIQKRHVLLTPMTPDQLTQAMVRPLEQIGMGLTQPLIATMIGEISNQPAALPLLQYALTVLFDNRKQHLLTQHDYQETGGVLGALARRADAIYDELAPQQQALVQQICLRLVTLGEGIKDTRRRVLLSELTSIAEDEGMQAIDPILSIFGENRLFTFDQDPVSHSPTVEITHEALLRVWPRFQTWIRDSREDVRKQRELAAGSQQWIANSRDESYLLRGNRLLGFEQWLDSSSLRLTGEEEAFLQASFEARQDRQAQEAAQQRRIIEAYSLSLSASAQQALSSNQPQLALRLALTANAVEDPPDAAWRTLIDVAYAPGIKRETQYRSGLNDIAVSKDGSVAVIGTEDGHLLIYDVATNQIEQQIKAHTDQVFSVAISENGKYALSGGGDKVIKLWERETGKLLRQFSGHKGAISTLHVLPDQKHFISTENSSIAPGESIIWNLDSGSIASRFGADLVGYPQGILDLSISGNGSIALIGQINWSRNNEYPLSLWDIRSGTLLKSFQLSDAVAPTVALSANGKKGVAGCTDGKLLIIDIETQSIESEFQLHTGSFTALTMSPNDQFILSAGKDLTIQRFNLESKQIDLSLSTAGEEVRQIRVIDASTAITVSSNGYISLWDLSNHWCAGRWKINQYIANKGDEPWMTPFFPMDYAPQRDMVAIGGANQDHIISAIMLSDGLNHRMIQLNDIVFRIRLLPDGKRLLAALPDGYISLLDIDSGSEQYTLHSGVGMCHCIAVNHDGSRALTGHPGGAIVYWDLERGERLNYLIGHFEGRGATEIIFFENDQFALSGSWDSSIILWELQKGEQIRRYTGNGTTLGGHSTEQFNRGVGALAISPDGSEFISGGMDHLLILWDVETGLPQKKYIGHSDSISAVIYSPDGLYIYSIDISGSFIIWDVYSGELLHRLPVDHGNFDIRYSKLFLRQSDDGATILTYSHQGGILEWRTATIDNLALAKWIAHNREIRSMTPSQMTRLGVIENLGKHEMLSRLSLSNQTEKHSTKFSFTDQTKSIRHTFSARFKGQLTIGTHHSRLLPNQFDVWEFVADGGESLRIEMVPEHPIIDMTISRLERDQIGQIDPVLIVRDPQGKLIAKEKGHFLPESEGSTTTIPEARIEMITLHKRGKYRVEARSFLDMDRGAYTLMVSPQRFHGTEKALLEYTGHYIEGPYEFDATLKVVEQTLVIHFKQSGESFPLYPIGPDKFYSGEGSIYIFERDEKGTILGYKYWLSKIHPIGGQWYSARKVDLES